jgi:hypothetical protein
VNVVNIVNVIRANAGAVIPPPATVDVDLTGSHFARSEHRTVRKRAARGREVGALQEEPHRETQVHKATGRSKPK